MQEITASTGLPDSYCQLLGGAVAADAGDIWHYEITALEAKVQGSFDLVQVEWLVLPPEFMVELHDCHGNMS